MKKHIFLFFALFAALYSNAQTVVKGTEGKTATITLRTGAVLSYTSEEYDSIRVLSNLELTSGVGIKIYLKSESKSKDYLASSYEFVDESGGKDDGNSNRNIKTTADYNAMPTSWRLEYPHLGNGNYAYSVPTSIYNGKTVVTYTVEWDCSKKSNHWTCYQFSDDTPKNSAGRSQSSFSVDPNISTTYQWTHNDYSYSGFSRGHMCMSDDRQYNEDSNTQTFYTTNIHPQYQYHNSGVWLGLENWVNSRGYDRDFCDTLYVVKAGTIDSDDQIYGYTDTSDLNGIDPSTGQAYTSGKTCSSHILIPKYFYMCVLAVKDNNYKAIGFWTEHNPGTKTNQSSKNDPSPYAKSIDEIEELTGIDFFCNLPDNIEKQVEASYNLSDW